MSVIKLCLDELRESAVKSLDASRIDLDEAATSISLVSSDLEYASDVKSVESTIRRIIGDIDTTKTLLENIAANFEEVDKKNNEILNSIGLLSPSTPNYILQRNQEINNLILDKFGESLDVLIKTTMPSGEVEELTDTTQNYNGKYAEEYGDFLEVPIYSQIDYAGIPYARNDIKGGGCGITCIAEYLTKKGIVTTPPELAAAYDKGKSSVGTDSDTIMQILNDKGVAVERVASWTESWSDKVVEGGKVIDALKNGDSVIVKVGKGKFTENGHYIMLTGITDDEKLIIYDPNGANWNNMADEFKDGFDITDVSSCAMDCFILNSGEVAPKTMPEDVYQNVMAQAEAELSNATKTTIPQINKTKSPETKETNTEIIPEVPQYLQQNYDARFGKGAVSTGGCSVTCLAMWAAMVHDDKTITPDKLADQFGEFYIPDVGADWGIVDAFSKEYDVTTEQLSWSDWNDKSNIEEMLKSGQGILVNVDSSSKFTDGGHYILVYGITDDGKLLVRDPNKYNYSEYNEYPDPVLAEGFENGFDAETVFKGCLSCWTLESKESVQTRKN